MADSNRRPAGYGALVERYGLHVIPNRHRSWIAIRNVAERGIKKGIVEETYPRAYWPGEATGDHLEFALKYDGTNLAILSAVFEAASPDDLVSYIRSKPTGKYARRLWFLYEFLTGRRLPLDDVTTGNYVDLLDPEEYYTAVPPRKSRRQRVRDNLPGDSRFCPLVRRTDLLKTFEAADLTGRCRALIAGHAEQLVKRAMSYLYTKETRCSFEIERIKPNASRVERFAALLRSAEAEDYLRKPRLIKLQNSIVEPRFKESDYRAGQNYVGETVGFQEERVHFVCPKPGDLAELMEGLIASHRRMAAGCDSAVIHAAAVAYGFVYLHPFEDGNGRIHRFLIHNILARRGFTPPGVIFPVSASMLKNRADYDASLEAFSRPLMSLVDYSLDAAGRMTVQGDTARWYRYIDMTPQAEALFRFIAKTIEVELKGEVNFLLSYDRTVEGLRNIVDMPDRLMDLFVRLCLQNRGRLSANKRTAHFDFLSDDEVRRMEEVVRSCCRPHLAESD